MMEYKIIVPPYYSTPATTFLLPRYSSPFLSFCYFSFCFAICPFLLFLSLVFFFSSYPPIMIFDLLQLFQLLVLKADSSYI